VRAILHREELGPTAFGQAGVAFPEARHPVVGRTLGAIALSRGGIEFDDAYPTGGLIHILFLVASPPSRPGEFLRAVEMNSWLLLGHEDFRHRLRRAGTREEVVDLIAEADRDALWEAGRARLRPDRPSDAPSGA
jgi:mannitol/fructose-specific phosphotransferase system IIA component (Ntr-type)